MCTDRTNWYHEAQTALWSKIKTPKRIEEKAKNVIFFLGDGMSLSTITAARIFKGQLEGLSFGEEAELNFEKFPNIGISKVYLQTN